MVDVGTDLNDLAGELMPQNRGQGHKRITRSPLVYVNIRSAQASRSDANQDIRGADLGLRHFQDIDPRCSLGLNNGFHFFFLR